MSDLLKRLKHIVGDSQVLDQKQVAQRASHFWDSSPMRALALVRPADTCEVSEILKLCHSLGQPVVTHGGLTGLVDGEKANSDEVVLSLERMRNIESVDAMGRTMTVQAGCVLQQVQEAAAEHDLLYGLDLGARGSCTVGGNVSTNAGGLSVLRYGMTREQVLGLEVVLADGTVLNSMNALLKNNAGYDLKQLFIGSEGTLGVITRVVLRLRPNTPSVNTAILGFDSFKQVSDTLAHMSANLNSQLNAFEIIWNEFYRLSTNENLKGSTKAPLSNNYAAYAIVESQGSNSDADGQLFMQALESAVERGHIVDAVVAKSAKERAQIWTIRENVDLVLRHQPAFIYDISLPINTMESYLAQVREQLQALWPEVVVYAYGHLADNNLHITVAPTPANYVTQPQNSNIETAKLTEEQQRWYEACNKIMFEPLTKIGGTVSAEHGIGLMKKPYLHYSRTEAEIATMRLLKTALDPANILNPGKII